MVDLLLKSSADEKNVDTDGRSPASVIGHCVRTRDKFPEDVERVRALLANAPADRAWRRRGLLTMCRATPSRLEPTQEGSVTHAGMTPRAHSRANPARTEAASTSGGDKGEGAFVEVSRPDWTEVAFKVVGLLEEGIFRAIVGFL